VRVAREGEHAGELALGDHDRAQGHVKLVGDLLAVSTLRAPEQAVNPSHGNDRTGRPRLRLAATDDPKASGIGEHLPRDPGIGPSDAACAVRGG
jgi:hypothetical protein